MRTCYNWKSHLWIYQLISRRWGCKWKSKSMIMPIIPTTNVKNHHIIGDKIMERLYLHLFHTVQFGAKHYALVKNAFKWKSARKWKSGIRFDRFVPFTLFLNDWNNHQFFFYQLTQAEPVCLGLIKYSCRPLPAAEPVFETRVHTVRGWRPWTVRPLGPSDNWLSNKELFLSWVLSDTHINLSSLRAAPPSPPTIHPATTSTAAPTFPLHPQPRSLLPSIPSTPLLLTC